MDNSILQLILHLFGDYVLQSDWMATNKTQRSIAAFSHATVYTFPFVFLTTSPLALFVIWISHFLIDRFRLARYVCYIKNLIFAPPAVWLCLIGNAEEGDELLTIKRKYRWSNCSKTGYPLETPEFLAVWLLIIADNSIHLLINFLSIKYL